MFVCLAGAMVLWPLLGRKYEFRMAKNCFGYGFGFYGLEIGGKGENS